MVYAFVYLVCGLFIIAGADRHSKKIGENLTNFEIAVGILIWPFLLISALIAIIKGE